VYRSRPQRRSGIMDNNWLTPNNFGAAAAWCMYVISRCEIIYRHNSVATSVAQSGIKQPFSCSPSSRHNTFVRVS